MTAIPRKISYEMFFIVIGLAPLLFFGWLYLFYSEAFLKIIPNTKYLYIWALIIGGFIFLFLHGVRELASNYYRTKDIRIREDIIKQYELDKQIKTLPKRYRDFIFRKKKKKKR